MLRLLRLPVEIARMIDTAEAERMRKLSEQKIREALDHQALNAADIERDLLGFISRAATGDDVVVSIPSSLQVAVVGGPSIDALQSIIAAAGGADDSARKGEAKYMPH